WKCRAMESGGKPKSGFPPLSTALGNRSAIPTFPSRTLLLLFLSKKPKKGAQHPPAWLSVLQARSSIGICCVEAVSLLGRDPQRLHLAVQVRALQAQHVGGAGDVALGLVELLEDVVALGRLADLMQAAEALDGAVEDGAAGAVQRDVARVDARLRIHDHDTLHQVAQLADVAGPRELLQRAHRLRRQFLGLAA